MKILDLFGMYFDAAVLFVTSQTLLFRLALVMLWISNDMDYESDLQIHQSILFYEGDIKKHSFLCNLNSSSNTI